MTKQITAADLQSPERPGDGWYIIEAAGEYPKTVEIGEERVSFVQELTAETLEKIAEAGVPEEGLLIDRDHLSMEEDQPTEAMGWVRELAICEGNLAARIEWTSIGRKLIEGKVYKHFSTVYPLEEGEARSGRVKPERLVELALTNRPNNGEGQPPITNRENTLPTGANAPADEQRTQKETKMTYPNELLALLGLAEGATDEEVIATVQSLKQGADAAAEAEADAVVNSTEAEEGAQLNDEEKKECKKEVLANREHGLKYTRLLCQNKALKNRQTQPANPERKYAGSGKLPVITNRKVDETERAITNRANELIADARKAGRSMSYWTAVAAARNEISTQA